MLKKISNKRLTLIIFVVGVLLSLAAMKLVQNTVDNKESLRLKSTSNEIVSKIVQSVNIMKYGLAAANGLFAASEVVNRDEFRDYVFARDLAAEFPGTSGFGFAEIVDEKKLTNYWRKNYRGTGLKFEDRNLSTSDKFYLIKYIEPLEKNKNALGYNIASEKRRRDAAETAMRTGLPTLTKKIKLVQSLKEEAGFLYLKPVYRNDAKHSTEQERIDSIIGWVFCPITLENTVQKVIEDYGKLFHIAIFDGLTNSNQELLYKSTDFEFRKQDLNFIEENIEVGQQNWTISLYPKKAFFLANSDQYLPLAVLTLGILLSLIISYFVLRNIRIRELSYSKQVQEGEDFIKGIIESANFSIIVTNPSGVIRIFNRAASEMLGYDSTEVVGIHTPALFHEVHEIEERAKQLTAELNVDIPPGFEVFTAKCKRGIPDVSEWSYLRKDGTRFPVSLSISAVKNYRDEIIAYVGIGDDISEKKIVEKKIKESEERFKSSFLHASHGIALVGMDGKWLKTNLALCQMLGRTEAELMRVTFQDITHPDDLEIDLNLMHKTIANEIENYHIEKRYFHLNGEIIWVLLSVSLVRAADGTPVHFVSQIQNITEQKHAEKALAESKAHLELLIESTFSATWDWQIAKDQITFNQTWADIIGYQLGDISPLTYKKFLSLIHPQDVSSYESSMNSFVSGDTNVFQHEYRMMHRDGRLVWVYDTGKIISFDKNNRPIRVLGTHLDISNRKAQEQELIDAKVSAVNAGNIKSKFLANMSHEIRTPLASIIGYSESLQEDNLNEDETLFAINTVLKNGNHLLNVINDILDLSKIEAGKLNVEIIPTDLVELLSDVANLMHHRAKEKKLSIGFEYKYPIPQVILTDPIRLKQILINLLGNAVKFTMVGGVKIIVGYQKEAQLMTFAVVDTGPGLTIEQQNKLFRASSQGDTSITRKFGGTGLGLVISAELAKKLGGNITLESKVGQGSVFTISIATGEVVESESVIEFRNNRISQTKSKKTKTPELSGKVLVAEDGEDNRNLISFLLRKTGLDFEMVEDGAQAVRQAESGNFDLILMDIQMPVMDGYTAMREIRNLGIEIPIIALTANTMKEDIDEAYANKCTDFLGKPFRRAEFFEKLKLHLSIQQVREKKLENKTVEAIDSPVAANEEELRIISNIVSKFALRFDELVQSFEERNWELLQRTAHTLKGSTSIIGLDELATAAAEIEKLAKRRDAAISEKFKGLKVLMEEVENCKDVLSLCNSSSIFFN